MTFWGLIISGAFQVLQLFMQLSFHLDNIFCQALGGLLRVYGVAFGICILLFALLYKLEWRINKENKGYETPKFYKIMLAVSIIFNLLSLI
jgi:hypothetical protein